jgi:signal transduction histidine kinase
MLRKQPSIRSRLTYLVLACVLPVWLLAGSLVLHAYNSKLNQANANLQQTARTITTVVDGQLAQVLAALEALATSPSFDTANFADLHRQTLEILKAYPGADIIVADSTGQQVVNSFRPYGSPLPKRNNLEIVRKIFADGKPVISDLFFGAVTKRPLVALDVPVFRNGKIVYDLSMTFPSDRVAAILPRQNWPSEWFCSVLDRKHVIVARTSAPGGTVGKPAEGLARAMAKRSDGTAEVTTATGVRALTSFCTSHVSGWSVAFAVPKATVMGDIWHWMLVAIGGAAVISIIGIRLAIGIARRIARDIHSLVPPAVAIGQGEAVGPFDFPSVKETAEVARALVRASELLQARASELSETMAQLKKETAERLQAMEELRRKEQLLVHQSRQAALGEMIGNIAHQWRQPLNSLALLVQQPPLMNETGELTGGFLEENSNKAMAVIKHMSHTIDDFRNFFQPDKEKVTFSIRDEVAKTLSLMEGSLQRHQVTVQVDARDEVATSGYPNEFSQVLLNILINARDAIAERNIAAPRIVITMGETGGKAVVTIADNAGGIPEEIIDKIFDPYFTTKGPQSGTGVGLFMSKTIIEKSMGGVLSVRNVNGGAEFRIEL